MKYTDKVTTHPPQSGPPSSAKPRCPCQGKAEYNVDLNALAVLASWYKKLAQTNNETFMPLFEDRHRYLVLKGGGGSGKSIFVGRKILERCISEPGHRFLVCRKVARTLRESCFSQLSGQLAEHYKGSGYKINDMRITFPNGSEILFAGLDDVEKLKSIYNITGIWIEEASEIKEADFNQLDIRLRGKTAYYKQIILSFNPISIHHWLKKRFFDCENLPEKDKKKIRTHESTYLDNRFLDKEARAVLEAFKYIDEYYYEVYCLGFWGITGKSVFNSRSIAERLLNIPKAQKTGYFEFDYDGKKITNIRFTEDEVDGFIRVYYKPERGVPYVIGGDTAGDGSDSFVAQVLDNRTGRQVCTLRHTFDEDLYARQVYCLGIWYEAALIALENNYSTYPTAELERLDYPNLYVREVVDDYTHKHKKAYGFVTSKKTRPMIISELIKVVRDDITLVCDKTTLEEMQTFVRNEDFRPEAEEGAHDDCVMALAIAHFIRPHQRYSVAMLESEREWTESMWEDFENASESEKEYLIRTWGRPKR